MTRPGLCGGGIVPSGNLTGGSGDAACIDTDVVGPALEVLVGTDTPGPATIDGYDVLVSFADNVGNFGIDGEIQSLQLTPGEALHICFRYSGDYDWYAQIDDVTVSAKNCSGGE